MPPLQLNRFQFSRCAFQKLWSRRTFFFFALTFGLLLAQAPNGLAQPFGVYRQLWTGLGSGGSSPLDVLTNTSLNPNWPDNPNPSYTKVFDNFETEVDSGLSNYGERLRTFVVPPTNGNYVFWISSDDASQLYVSTDETPANKV